MADLTAAPDTASVALEAPESSSLADHERAFLEGRAAETATAPAEPTTTETKPTATAEPAADATEDEGERDENGRFKPRHRAKSQQASVEDVPRIRELTRRLRETEAQLESERQARIAPKTDPAPAARETATKTADGFPKFEAWVTLDGNAEKSFEDFMDARADWRYDQRRSAERAEEARTAAERQFQTEADAYLKQIPAVQKKYPDFDEVVASAPRVSKVLERASILAGPETAYYLATHPEDAEALSNETLVHPDNPAFKATVAATKRYLLSLVAPEQRSASPSRAAAAQTGSALALVSPTVPRPPNPVRTAALRDGEALPTDESSLADHERAFGPGRRRA